VLGVAGSLEIAKQRRVDQAVADPRRLQRRLDQPCHHGTDHHRLARIGVELRELAVGLEAGELPVPLEQAPPGALGCLARPSRGSAARHDHGDAAAEAGERLDHLGLGHRATNSRARGAASAQWRQPPRRDTGA
jgi:hypothetical protein